MANGPSNGSVKCQNLVWPSSWHKKLQRENHRLRENDDIRFQNSSFRDRKRPNRRFEKNKIQISSLRAFPSAKLLKILLKEVANCACA